MDALFSRNAKVLNFAWSHTHISSQLSMFGVLHNAKLILAGCNLLPTVIRLQDAGYQKPESEGDVKRNTYCDTNINPKFYAFAPFFYLIGFVYFSEKVLRVSFRAAVSSAVLP